MNILGICFGHGAAAVLLKDGKLVAAIEEEKLSRIKGHAGFPFLAIEFSLNQGNLNTSQLDHVAVGCSDIAEWSYSFQELAGLFKQSRTHRLLCRLLDQPRRWYPNLNVSALYFKYFYRQMARLGYPKEKIFLVDHHSAHAVSAYCASPWTDSVIVTSDGKGDGVSSSFSMGKNQEIRRINTQPDSVSIGQLYQAVTKHLGYKHNRHEGKITGLAAYGDASKTYAIFNSVLQHDGKGNFINKFHQLAKFNQNPRKYYASQVRRPIWLSNKYVQFLYGRLYRYGICYELYLQLMQQTMSGLKPADIAAGVQKLSEDLLVSYVQAHLSNIGTTPVNICLAGGLFANVKINQRIQEIQGVKNVFVQPAMDDAGTALGAALWAWLQKSPCKRNENGRGLETVYLGPSFSEKEMAGALEANQIQYKKVENIEEEIARFIFEGKIVGRFNGALEWGPRSLGNRSILARPIDNAINDSLNHRLKRTEFMPFAPSMLDDDAPRFLENYSSTHEAAKYMTITYNVNEEGSRLFPAAVHVDGTARPQVVTQKDNASFYRIIQEYKKLSGFGVILNTSFNMHEEPIVNSPQDAIRSFQANAVDVLAMGPFVATR